MHNGLKLFHDLGTAIVICCHKDIDGLKTEKVTQLEMRNSTSLTKRRANNYYCDTN